MKYEEKRMEDCCISISDGDHLPPPKSEEGVPFITISNIDPMLNSIDFSDSMYVPKEYFDSLSDIRKATQNDILYTVVGSFGIPVLIKEKTDFVFQRHIAILRPNKEVVIPEYLYYIMKSKRFYAQADIYAIGSAQRTLSLSSLRRMKVSIPALEQQRKIIDLVLPYDQLIETNNKRIKVLETIAESLYKEWFVRFRYPGHKEVIYEDGIPKGWKRKKIKDLAIEVDKPERAENRDQFHHYLPIDCLPSRSMSLKEEDTIDNAESSLISFKKGDILFGAMRPYFHKVIIAPFDGLTRTTCFVFNARENVYKYYLYLLMFQKSTIDYATTVAVGSTMPYDRWKDFSRMNIIVPDVSTITQFNTYIEPIIYRIIGSYKINQQLIEQRDLLLSRLMSGKLEV